MKTTNIIRGLGLAHLALALCLLGMTGSARAGEKCTIEGTNLAEESEYTQQYVIDVGDMPGHQARIFEVHRKLLEPTPNCEGLKEVEIWLWGYSDYTDGNGRAWGYFTSIYDNGDKMFGEWSGTSQRLPKPVGQATGVYTGTSIITGGTGVYKGVRGTGRDTVYFDPETGYNEEEFVTEYWIED